MANASSWRIRGTYFESCNCEAICPCRMVGGVPGGRSTYGECYGVLSWRVEDGRAGDVDLSGLAAALVLRYDDDEPGSPWTFVVHVDERGTEEQRTALAEIITGRRGGEHILKLPWVRKPGELVAVRASRIDIRHVGSTHELRIGSAVELRASTAVITDVPVACGISGYHEAGTELLADALRVDDDPFAYELAGNCAFTSAFDYTG